MIVGFLFGLRVLFPLAGAGAIAAKDVMNCERAFLGESTYQIPPVGEWTWVAEKMI
jgi:hypothetical protein